MTAARQAVIVDDHPINLDILRLTLELVDTESIAFADGGAALDYLEHCAEVPPVMIVDRMMPGLDGLELVRRLRANPRFDPMRIIIASASGEPEEIAEGRAAGANDYLTKPFAPDDLIRLLAPPA